LISDSDPAETSVGLFAPDGALAGAFVARSGDAHAFEARPQQLDMARAVDRALSSGRHALIEAGTGVGKSFAYLVPALRWAMENDARVAVATSTIALQEQLVRRDLPLLASALPFDVRYALVKGRGNYLCLRRLDRALEVGAKLFADEASDQLLAIRNWAGTTTDGSRQDLPFQPLASVWQGVQAERGNCLGRACRHYERCPYQRSRRGAHDAQLLVLNHHVLMADLALRRRGSGFLPELDAVIIDEAHDLEDTAAEHLGVRVSARGVQTQLGRLWSAGRRKGLLAGHPDSRLRLAVEGARNAARVFFGETQALLGTGGVRAAMLPTGAHLPDALSPRLAELASMLLKAARSADAETALEIGARARGIRELAEGLAAVARDELDDQVRWGEVGARGQIALHSAPVEVGPLLSEVLFEAHHAVILTSATLSAGRPPAFDFLRRRLGVPDGDEVEIGSPFDYARQARLVLRTDLPDPSRERAAYEEALPAAVLRSVRRTNGGAFVLFTSVSTMRKTAEALRVPLEELGLRVWVQGESLERPALLDAFREGGGVLFGVASFWQGVDVPGDALRHVVITRLPFEVPTHPLQVARSRRLEERGLDPFRDLSLPTAALRLKQGFGRLIRHTTDEGIVTILDRRVSTRAYGRVLLAGLPTCPIEQDDGT